MKNIGPEILDPLFHFLDRVMYEYGDILFIVLGYLAMAILAWVFSGGLRRRLCQGNESPRVSSVIVIPLLGTPTSPPESLDPFARSHEPPHTDPDSHLWE